MSRKTMGFDDRLTLSNRIAADFQDKTSTSQNLDQLCTRYTKLLGFPVYDTQMRQEMKRHGIIFAKRKPKKVTMDLYNELEARVDELEKDNELLAGKLDDLEAQLETLAQYTAGVESN